MSKDQLTPTLDLREFCRDKDKIDTVVYLHCGLEHQFEWLKLAQIRLQSRGNRNFPGVWVFDSYLGDRSDFEGDSAFLVSFELIGVQFEGVSYGQTRVTAFINPNYDKYDTFGVPTSSDYDPVESNGSIRYQPEDNRELYKKVRGKRVTIITGTKDD